MILRLGSCAATLVVASLFQPADAANFGQRRCCCSTPVCAPAPSCTAPVAVSTRAPATVCVPRVCPPGTNYSVSVPGPLRVVSETRTAQPSPLASGTPTKILRTYSVQQTLSDGSVVQETRSEFQPMTPTEELNFLRDEVQDAQRTAGSDAVVIKTLRERVNDLRGEVYGGPANPPAKSRIDKLVETPQEDGN